MIPLKAMRLRARNIKNKLESRYWYPEENNRYNSYTEEYNRIIQRMKVMSIINPSSLEYVPNMQQLDHYMVRR
jgi:hypothetical protein